MKFNGNEDLFISIIGKDDADLAQFKYEVVANLTYKPGLDPEVEVETEEDESNSL